MAKTTEYRGFVSFSSSDVEFTKFKMKINRYYKWCEALGLNPEDDENYIGFCESNQG